MKEETVLKKVVLLGDSAVGKTSLIRRFVDDRFDDGYISTVGAKVSKKVVEIPFTDMNNKVTMMIWDIIGSRGFESTQSRHIAGLDGAILVVDISRPETADSLEKYWIPLLTKVVGYVPPRLLFMGNKLDLVESKDVIKQTEDAISKLGAKYSDETIKKMDEKPQCWLLSSAKSGENVEAGFKTLATMMLAAHPKFDPLFRQMEDLAADIIYSTSERATPRSILDMVIADLPLVLKSTETSTTILHDCISRLGVNKVSPDVKNVEDVVDCVLRLAAGKGAKDITIEGYRSKWLGTLSKIK